MRRSKKIFALFAFIFFLLLVFVVYDISNRTTFPGSRPVPIDSVAPIPARDSVVGDSAR